MNFKNIGKIVVALLFTGCSTKVNEATFNRDKAELYKIKDGYKLVVKEPRTHILFPITMKDAVVKYFYFDENGTLRRWNINYINYEGYGGNDKNIKKEDEEKAQRYLDELLK